MKIFNDQQVDNWREYESVRQGGRYNMFDPNARALTGLDRDDYLFCMKNYSELKEAAEYEDADAITE